jgi:hypothetical protein
LRASKCFAPLIQSTCSRGWPGTKLADDPIAFSQALRPGGRNFPCERRRFDDVGIEARIAFHIVDAPFHYKHVNRQAKHCRKVYVSGLSYLVTIAQNAAERECQKTFDRGGYMAGSRGRRRRLLGAGLILMMAAVPSVQALAADPTAGRREAYDAADAAAGLLRPDPGVPVCAKPPPSGQKLAGDMDVGSGGHSIQVANAGGGDALVNIRHADTRKLANRFYLRSNEQMVIEGVPDGLYLIQYAFGPALGTDCKTFTRIIRARELPESDDLQTQTIETEAQTEVKHSSVAYEISVSESGNMKPVNIDAAAFNAE